MSITSIGMIRGWLSVLFCLGSMVGLSQQKKRLIEDWVFLKQDVGGVWEAVRAVGPGSPQEVPFWTSVTLPHSFNAVDAVDPDVNYYQGPGWYKTALTIDNPYEGGRTLLHFEGAGQKTEVYIYLTKVGEHVGGYDEWSVDITEAVEAFKRSDAYADFGGKIPLSIRCDNSRDLEMIPSDMSDFNLYGGIYRYLNLTYVPALSIDKLFVKAEMDPIGNLTIRSRFYNPLEINQANVSVVVSDPRGKVVASNQQVIKIPEGDADLWQLQIKRPVLWSPDHPLLYTIRATVETASGKYFHQEKVGFRHFEFVKKGPFKLNGTRLLLRGTHRHEDHAGVANAMSESQMREEMIMMKDMGVNFIRLGHYQQSRIILDLCDSLGIMVWEEIPWCRGGLGGESYRQQAQRMLTNMIEQHYNHPSVIIWGLGNENDWPGDFPEFEKQEIRAFMSGLNDLAHQLDDSRKTAIRRCDFCKDIVDVYSPSIWAGWYRGAYTEYQEVSRREFETVDHFLHVEWGGDSHARRHAEAPDKVLAEIPTGKGADERVGDSSLYGGAARVSKDGDWSESYICNLIDWHLKEQENMPWLSGAAYWPFKDFSTPVRPENPVPYMNQKGVVERDFIKKEAYYVFQSYWTDEPMAHIYGHSWPVRWGDKGELKMIKVYSNCSEAELFLNGKSLGVRNRNSQDFPAAGLRWMVAPKEGVNQVRVLARQGRQEVTDEISFRYQTEKWEAPARMELKKIKETGEIATVEVTLNDKNGNFCADASNWVEFSQIGDGRLLDNLGTSTGSRKVQCYNGRAIISLENTGTNFIGVKSEGIPSAFLKLDQADDKTQ